MKPNSNHYLSKSFVKLSLLSVFIFFNNAVFAQLSGCTLLCNSDFEDTQVTNPGSFILVDQSQIPCWSTTASDGMIEVWGSGFNGVPAYSGNQFIELNANMASTLFQNFQASPGSQVSISFAHRGRNGVDVMSVSIGEVGGPFTELGVFSTGNTQWQFYNVNYTFPLGAVTEYSLRFTAVSSVGGAATGNFLDAITIELPQPIIELDAINPSCPNSNDGSISVNIIGDSDPYTINWILPTTGGNNSSLTNLGEDFYLLEVTDFYGCSVLDSFTLVAQNQPTSSVLNVSTCNSYLWNGQSYSETGSYTFETTNVNGCDSVAILNLTIIPDVGTIPEPSAFNTGTDGNGGVLPPGSNDLNWEVAIDDINGVFFPAFIMSPIPGSYYNSPWPDARWIAHNATGNHSVNIDLYFKYDFLLPCESPCYGSIADEGAFCLNLDFFADNSVYEIYVNGVPQSPSINGMPQADPYFHIGFNQAGLVTALLCSDWQPGANTIIIHIKSGPTFAGFLAQSSVNQLPNDNVISDTLNVAICENQSIEFANQTITDAGMYSQMFQTAQGCDSLSVLNLSVNPVFSSVENIQACESYFWSLSNETYTNSGNYSITLSTIIGCDSVANLNLEIIQSFQVSQNASICEGESFSFDGNDLQQSGQYIANYTSTGGCDSVITLNLIVFEFQESELNVSICDGETFEFNGVDFNEGNYQVTLTSQNGCDSLVNLNVVNNELSYFTITDTLCKGEDYVFNNQTYNQSGEYTVNLTNNFNCDSIVTLQLYFKDDFDENINIPNVFSPNNDGVNDEFTLSGNKDLLTTFEVLIFNRWGNIIFQSTDKNFVWNGQSGNRPTTEGVYFYLINFTSECSANEPKQKNGNITLVK